jgi:cytochrome c oxidase assembly protein subunit 11
MRTRYSASRARQGVISAILLGSSVLAIASAQAADDVAAGRNLFASRCAACHGLNPTRKPGPLLSGVYGRRAGSVPGYHYSTALAGASIVWSTSNLNRWLSGPPAFIPGVNMQAKMDNAKERRNIIAYLKSLGPPTATHAEEVSAATNITK